MAQGSKVLLVRCPKCDNLLPELPDIPVYQCGGCGTVLQVKIKSTRTDGLSEKSDEERVKLGSAKSDSDREIDELVKIVHERDGNSSSSSFSRLTRNREVMTETMGTTGHVPKYKGSSITSIEDHKELMEPQIETTSLSHRPDQIPHNWPDPRRVGFMMNQRNERVVDEGRRYATTPYPDEGPSNYQRPSYDYNYDEMFSISDSNSHYGEPMFKSNSSNASERVEYLEQDRAELLRKLQELQDKLSGSCDINGKPKVLHDPYGSRDSRYSMDSPVSVRAPSHPYVANKHVQRPSYINQGRDRVPPINRPEMHDFYPQMHYRSESAGYPDSFAPQIHRRNPSQPPHSFQPRASHDYYQGRYMEFDRDSVSSYPHNTFFHQPGCSCYQCYNKNWQVPARVPPTLLRDRRFPNDPSSPILHHADNLRNFGSQGHYRGNANLSPLHTRERQVRVQISTDLDSELCSSDQQSVVVKKSVRRCNPIAGGAPFITCCNCFELLKLPRKFSMMEQKERKLKCGVCSAIITILVDNKKLICIKENSLEVNKGSILVVQESHARSSHHAKHDSTKSFSEDYDNSGYNFQSMDGETVSSNNPRLNVSDSERMEYVSSVSNGTSEVEKSPNSVICQKELAKSSELTPSKRFKTPPNPGSPLLEHFEYSSYHRKVDQMANENKSKNTDEEEVVQTKSISRQNSLKDAAATEMEVPFGEYSITGVSQDSNDTTKEEEQSKIGKGGLLFFEGLLKSDISDVSVNGQPLPTTVVKKAQKRAGRIHPGHYWYDYRAGFWGVMGQPCLGILPPSIEEFNYPMPKDCAGGNTGVCVNGRELHQKDLNLLASRGLPTTKDKSYIVEICGTVVDENTWEELESLGRLAPTIEKLKHGFGMKAPKVVA